MHPQPLPYDPLEFRLRSDILGSTAQTLLSIPLRASDFPFAACEAMPGVLCVVLGS